MTDNNDFYISISLNVVEHLGKRLYSNVPAVLSELVANAWDADATEVHIKIDSDAIRIIDNGCGMSYDEINKRYLVVGLDRREEYPGLTPRGRSPMGRKGLGKLAPFAIADRIEVHSFKDNRENALLMSMEEIKQQTALPGEHRFKLPRISFEKFSDDTQGTMVMLKNFSKRIDQVDRHLKKRLARRFSVLGSDEFRIYINDVEVTRRDRGYYETLQFLWCFGNRDEELIAECRNLESGGVFVLDNKCENAPDYAVHGWIGTIREHKNVDEADTAVVVYSRGKLVHENILKDFTEGGLYSKYVIGDIEADFLDSDDKPDIVTSNRQTLDETDERYVALRNVVGNALKTIQNQWSDLRRQGKDKIIETKVGKLAERLAGYMPIQAATAKKALKKLASVESLTDAQFLEMSNGLLTAMEQGRLHGLIQEISDMEEVDEVKLLQLLAESQVMTSLHVAEAVRTKLETIEGLKKRIELQQLENAVRDYIAEHPWLIAPEWDTFAVERSLQNILTMVSDKDRLDGPDWEKRVDLLLASGRQLLLLEFMRPGLKIDRDHMDRIRWYVTALRNYVETNTGNKYDSLDAYLVADRISEEPVLQEMIKDLKEKRIWILDWPTLLQNAIWNWKEFLAALIDRGPEDQRLIALKEYL